MYDHSIVELVDAAIDRHRHCSACGAPNMVQPDQERLFVVCSTLAEPPQTILGRLSAAFFPHDRVLILP